MNIAAMNVRITFQKNTVLTDSVGNHINSWVDYFSCYATTSVKTAEELEKASVTHVSDCINFTVRYCSETSVIEPDKYRIIMGERIYNILSVDDMGFKKKCLKMCAQRERDSYE